MRIDSPDSLGIHGAPDGNAAKPQPAKSPDAQGVRPDKPPPAADATYTQYILKAAAAAEVDLKAVAEARKLLESGQLDTPEAADRAADQIISNGI